MKKGVLFIIILISCLSVLGQRVEVSATVNRSKILIGEPIELYLKALVPKSGTTPWFALDTFPHFEVLSKSAIDSQVTERGLFLQQTVMITSWDSGRWELPPIMIQRAGTKPIAVEVTHTPMDPDQPYHDVKDILEVSRKESSNWYWYLLGIAVLIALFMLFFPPTEKKKEKPVVVEDPYKTAMERIDKLKEDDEPKLFQTELIAAYRNYLAQKKGLQSLSKTTDDLVVQLKTLNLPQDAYRQVTAAMQLSDVVKYARYQPSVSEQRQSLDVIRTNIKQIEQLN